MMIEHEAMHKNHGSHIGLPSSPLSTGKTWEGECDVDRLKGKSQGAAYKCTREENHDGPHACILMGESKPEAARWYTQS